MPKFTRPERNLIQGIVASLSIKRIPDAEIIKEIHYQTKKSISPKSLYNIRQRIKRESAKWYSQLRQGSMNTYMKGKNEKWQTSASKTGKI